MATEPTEISPRLLERARRLARERNCSVEDILWEGLDQIEEPAAPPVQSVLGLFSDDPDLVDDVLEDVYRSREQNKLR